MELFCRSNSHAETANIQTLLELFRLASKSMKEECLSELTGNKSKQNFLLSFKINIV